ncbi:hypothetical protein [Acetobacter oeni]|uniref:Uncharacterized protein n=1 Tax=Acetobacter oeni TaxID=304077 RepID=A0A511XLX0_9PROT|nr:hypothetical protein [Acetobacter oeni]MBB3882933.1 hypothetical protein [Acetobacter oeni]NHO19015.1 hypothetical protein [Acetobacter oeni]GBR04812.1 hypothetical protein AA21952_1537 [Acetobacter oeni LMG 21952]GEN63945.1 hypothetical protein AOE01nite_21690 [Acetobacter oeni]
MTSGNAIHRQRKCAPLTPDKARGAEFEERPERSDGAEMHLVIRRITTGSASPRREWKKRAMIWQAKAHGSVRNIPGKTGIETEAAEVRKT